MAIRRNRSKQTQSLDKRLSNEAIRLRGEVDGVPPGTARDVLVAKLQTVEEAIRMAGWLASPLKPPA